MGLYTHTHTHTIGVRSLKRSKLRKEKGITLVALVITIVVLLILAAVAIVSLTGENNIITKAQNAKDQTNQAQQQEYTELGNYENAINEWTGTNKQLIFGTYISIGGTLNDGTILTVSADGSISVSGMERGHEDFHQNLSWTYTDGKYYVNVNGQMAEILINGNEITAMGETYYLYSN